MDVPPGWRALRSPRRTRLPTPFVHLVRTHALSSAGDALVALALAGSLFFSISPGAARTRVALYLLLTMAPFAVVAPLLGPWMDRRRGGRRSMVVLAAAARAALCLLLISDVDGPLLFPEAFAVLVLSKGHNVARASLVPGLVHDEAGLVEANAKLVLISGVAGFLAALPGLALLQLGSPWVLGLAALTFAATTICALRVPRTRVAAARPAPAEKAELRGANILLAASATAVLRAIVGFLAFFLAFFLRTDGAPTWWFGLVLAVSAVGALLGAALAPPLRRAVREERILLGCLFLVALVALAVSLRHGAARPSAAVLAAVVGGAAGAGKLCFDAIVQRDAPDANQGRSFARFETRFQIVWVTGAFIPVVIPIPFEVGAVAVTVAAGLAAVSYATGRRLSAARLAARLLSQRERTGTRSRAGPSVR